MLQGLKRNEKSVDSEGNVTPDSLGIAHTIQISMQANFKNTHKNDTNKKAVELAFPKYEQEEDNEYISKGGTGEGLVKLSPRPI